MRLSFSLLIIFCFQLNSKAQIYQEKEDIIKELDSYETGIADDGSEYIYFDEEFKSERSGEYVRRKVLYFVELEDGTKICNMWKLLEPSTETNANVAFFKKNMVEIDYMKWKDYEREIMYEVEVEDKICVVWAWFDNKN